MPAELKASQVGLMTDYIYSLISSMVRERFLDITKKPNAPFRSASAYFNEFQGVARTKDALTFEAVANDGKYQDALKGLVMEIDLYLLRRLTMKEISARIKIMLKSILSISSVEVISQV